MARKTKEEAQQTREQLLKAAERLFRERGVSQTSLNDIANAAGLTRGAVYWHFQNKTDLIGALWDSVCLPLEQTFEEVEKITPNDPMARMQMKATIVLESVVTQPSIQNLLNIILLKCEYVDEPGGLREGYLTKRGECLQEITEGFEKAINHGQLPSTTDAKTAAIGMMALVDGLCFHWLMNPGLFDLKEKAAEYVSTYLNGLSLKGSSHGHLIDPLG